VHRAAHRLDQVRLDRALERKRIDDEAAVVRDGESRDTIAAARSLDRDFGDDRDHRTVARRVGDAASGEHRSVVARIRARARLPVRRLRDGLDRRALARIGEVTQAERDRVGARSRGELVDERFAREARGRPSGSPR